MNKNRLKTLQLAGETEIPNIYLQTSTGGETPPLRTIHDTLTHFKTLDDVRNHIGDCTRCKLCKTRTNIVFGDGNPKADLVFVGEGPGESEDLKALPFVGRAGQLLTKIIEAMGIKRSDVYIANVVKCRPPENRNPEPDEIASCSPFLSAQLEVIKPKVIVCLGTFAAQTLLVTETKIGQLRNNFHAWPNAAYVDKYKSQLAVGSIKLMPTYHPSFLLRNPSMKKPVWEDMKLVMQELGLKINGSM